MRRTPDGREIVVTTFGGDPIVAEREIYCEWEALTVEERRAAAALDPTAEREVKLGNASIVIDRLLGVWEVRHA